MRLDDHYVADPTAFALATMGTTAQKAADTWTVQEWAGKLAARAGPRDYVGQLRELYDDILQRWRYVQEQGERVPGSANAVLGHVLGAAYNLGAHCQSPEHCDVLRTPWNQRGFGDCDDISTVVAAGALAMGMTPLFRVARWPGGAHVSTLVQTPKGERVSLDPVGEPEHGFGWALQPQGGNVTLHSMGGGSQPALGATPMHHPTTLSGLPVHRRTGPEQFDRPHYVLTRPGDARGPRVLAIPTWNAGLMRRGYVVDGANAVDQFGDVYSYLRGADVWAPVGCSASPMGRWKLFGGRTKIGRRLAKAGRKIRRAATRAISAVRNSKVVKLVHKAKARILRSKLVQEVAARALQAFGVPPQATKAILAREAALAKRGGRLAMAEAIARGNMREAAQIATSTLAQGVRHGLSQLKPGGGFSLPMGSVQYVAPAFDAMRGWEDDRHELELLAEDGYAYPVAPVAGFEAVGGWHSMGALNITDEPELGKWYRVKSGDTFFGIVRRAMGPDVSNQDVTRQAQLINALAYNTRFHVDAPQGERNFWRRRISFTTRFTELPENQAQNPTTGGRGNGYPVIYMTATGEDPPPFEDPIAPPEVVIDEPEDDEIDVVVPPEEPPPVEPPPEPPPPPEEPPPPVEPPVDILDPIVPVLPPVRPPDPIVVVDPPPVLPPVLPPPVLPPVLPPPVYPPVLPPPEPPPPVYEVPSCPAGFAYDYNARQCVDVRPPPPPPDIVEPRWPVDPEPVDVEPVVPEPVVPTQPPSGGGFPWLLLAIVGGTAVGVPAPMVVAGTMLLKSKAEERGRVA